MLKQPKQPVVVKPIEWRAALVLYNTHGWTIARIASEYGVRYGTAWEHLRALGAKPRKSPAWQSVAGLRLHSIWKSIRLRCRSPKHPSYENYGGRGIDVSQAWERFEPFYEWATRAGYRPGMGIALIDLDRDFGPDNCRLLRARETRRAARRLEVPTASKCMVTAFGETKTLKAWGRDQRSKVSWIGLARRLRDGVKPEAAITSPHRSRWDPPLPRAQRPALKLPSPRTKIDWTHVVHLHHQRGLTHGEIASTLNLRPEAIAAGLRRLGALHTTVQHVTPDRRRLRKLWRELWARTNEPNHALYASNGGIGVRVCTAWGDFETFCRWAIESGTKPNLCLARIQRSGPYSPSNCRWITRSELTVRAARRRGARLRT